MTLEEAIVHAEDTAKSAIGCECREEHRQLAAWLRELQERRKQPEIIRCKDCIKGKYHNLAKSTMCMLHPFNPVRVEPDGFCKWAERRTDEMQ